MNILYGVAGEGTGHATRSKAVIEHLIARGHVVRVVASKRAFKFFKDQFDVVEIDGFELEYTDGALDLARSAAHNLAKGPQVLARNFAVMLMLDSFHADRVITDFEPFASVYARLRGIPAWSIDSLHIIHRCEHPSEITHGYEREFQLTRAAVGAVSPFCEQYVITTFFYPPVRSEHVRNTTLVPPILREAVLRATPRDGDAVLVYLTQSSDSSLFSTLGAFPRQRFLVYGIEDRGRVPSNCTMREASEDGFLADLISCRAVVTSGGVTLPHEALRLEKPVYSVPVRNHFEQIMNSRYLAGMGYGITSERFEPDVLSTFLANRTRYTEAIRAAGRQDGNKVLYGVIDGLL